MKKGVIFDMDGLLFDTEQIWQANWNRRAAELGFEMDPEFKYNICGTSGQLMVDVITRFFPDTDAEDFIRTVKKRVAEDVRKGVPEMPGLHEIIAYFHKNGLKMAVASSSDKDIIRNNLSKSDVLQYFDVLVSGQEVEHGRRIFSCWRPESWDWILRTAMFLRMVSTVWKLVWQQDVPPL